MKNNRWTSTGETRTTSGGYNYYPKKMLEECGHIIVWDGVSGDAGKQATKEAHEAGCDSYKTIRDRRRKAASEIKDRIYGASRGPLYGRFQSLCDEASAEADSEGLYSCNCGCEGDYVQHAKWLV